MSSLGYEMIRVNILFNKVNRELSSLPSNTLTMNIHPNPSTQGATFTVNAMEAWQKSIIY